MVVVRRCNCCRLSCVLFPRLLQAVFPNLESRLEVRMIGTPVTAQVRSYSRTCSSAPVQVMAPAVVGLHMGGRTKLGVRSANCLRVLPVWKTRAWRRAYWFGLQPC